MIKRENVLTIDPDTTLEDAARLMVENRIGALPVIEEGVVVGIITQIDMMVQLVSLLGGGVPGVRVTVRMPNRKGELAKVTGAVAQQGWGIYASGGVIAPKRPDFWDCVLKVKDVPKDELVAVIEKIEGQEVIDVREV